MSRTLLVISGVALLAAIIFYQIAVMDEESFTFVAEWFDEEAAMTRIFRMLYFPVSNKLQLFEPRTHKMFLKKTAVEGLRADDIFVGNTILVLSRMFNITAYADEYTRNALDKKSERTFAMVKPDAVRHMGAIIQHIQTRGLMIRAASLAVLSESHATEFYAEHTGKPFLPSLLKYITSGPVLALTLQGEGAVSRWRRLIGPTDPVQALAEDPTALRARFGTDKTYNGFHGSDSLHAASREISMFFPSKPRDKHNGPKSAAKFSNSTCCVVKPHLLAEGKLGEVISAIQEGGFTISGLEMVRFDKASAAEFLEVYDGVVYEFAEMMSQLQSGPSVVLEITQTGRNNEELINEDAKMSEVVQSFRELVGPMDPELAKKIRPNSLRARFGKNKILNALHCTDLPEDGKLEVEYAFKILKGGW